MERSGILLVLVLSWTLAHAQQEESEEDPAAPPPLPPPAARKQAESDAGVPIPPKVQDEQIAPEVRIHRDEQENVIEEYSLDGRVYMVKVTPKVGLPYYYLDDDGDGQLELQERDAAASPVKPVYWKVKEWD